MNRARLAYQDHREALRRFFSRKPLEPFIFLKVGIESVVAYLQEAVRPVYAGKNEKLMFFGIQMNE